MARRLALLALLALAIIAVPASAQARILSIREAKAYAARTAEKVKRDLLDEGATRAKVPGCWRNSPRKVSCFFSVYGYDPELDYRWECMLRVVVRLRAHPTPGHRYSVYYGHAVCG